MSSPGMMQPRSNTESGFAFAPPHGMSPQPHPAPHQSPQQHAPPPIASSGGSAPHSARANFVGRSRSDAGPPTLITPRRKTLAGGAPSGSSATNNGNGNGNSSVFRQHSAVHFFSPQITARSIQTPRLPPLPQPQQLFPPGGNRNAPSIGFFNGNRPSYVPGLSASQPNSAGVTGAQNAAINSASASASGATMMNQESLTLSQSQGNYAVGGGLDVVGNTLTGTQLQHTARSRSMSGTSVEKSPRVYQVGKAWYASPVPASPRLINTQLNATTIPGVGPMVEPNRSRGNSPKPALAVSQVAVSPAAEGGAAGGRGSADEFGVHIFYAEQQHGNVLTKDSSTKTLPPAHEDAPGAQKASVSPQLQWNLVGKVTLQDPNSMQQQQTLASSPSGLAQQASTTSSSYAGGGGGRGNKSPVGVQQLPRHHHTITQPQLAQQANANGASTLAAGSSPASTTLVSTQIMPMSSASTSSTSLALASYQRQNGGPPPSSSSSSHLAPRGAGAGPLPTPTATPGPGSSSGGVMVFQHVPPLTSPRLHSMSSPQTAGGPSPRTSTATLNMNGQLHHQGISSGAPGAGGAAGQHSGTSSASASVSIVEKPKLGEVIREIARNWIADLQTGVRLEDVPKTSPTTIAAAKTLDAKRLSIMPTPRTASAGDDMELFAVDCAGFIPDEMSPDDLFLGGGDTNSNHVGPDSVLSGAGAGTTEGEGERPGSVSTGTNKAPPVKTAALSLNTILAKIKADENSPFDDVEMGEASEVTLETELKRLLLLLDKPEVYRASTFSRKQVVSVVDKMKEEFAKERRETEEKFRADLLEIERSHSDAEDLVREQHAQKLAEEREVLQQIVQDFEKSAEDQSAAVTQVRLENEKLQSELDRIKGEIQFENELLRQRLGLSRKDVHESLLTGARKMLTQEDMEAAQLAWTERILTEKEAETEDSKRQIAALEQALASTASEYELKLESETALRVEADNLASNLKEELADKSVLEENLLQTSQAHEQLQQEHEALRSQLEAAQKVNMELEEAQKKLQEQLQQNDEMIAQLEQEVVKSESEQEKLAQRSSVLREEQSKLEGKIADLQSQDELRLLALARLEEALEDARKDAEMNKSHYTAARSDNQQLREQLVWVTEQVESGLLPSMLAAEQTAVVVATSNTTNNTEAAAGATMTMQGAAAGAPTQGRLSTSSSNATLSLQQGVAGGSGAFGCVTASSLRGRAANLVSGNLKNAGSPVDGSSLAFKKPAMKLGPAHAERDVYGARSGSSPTEAAAFSARKGHHDRLRSVIKLLKTQLDSLRQDWQRSLESEQEEKIARGKAVARLQDFELTLQRLYPDVLDKVLTHMQRSYQAASGAAIILGGGGSSSSASSGSSTANSYSESGTGTGGVASLNIQTGGTSKSAGSSKEAMGGMAGFTGGSSQLFGAADGTGGPVVHFSPAPRAHAEGESSCSALAGLSEEAKLLGADHCLSVGILEEGSVSRNPNSSAKQDLHEHGGFFSQLMAKQMEDQIQRNTQLQRQVADLEEKLLTQEIQKLDADIFKKASPLQERHEANPMGFGVPASGVGFYEPMAPAQLNLQQPGLHVGSSSTADQPSFLNPAGAAAAKSFEHHDLEVVPPARKKSSSADFINPYPGPPGASSGRVSGSGSTAANNRSKEHLEPPDSSFMSAPNHLSSHSQHQQHQLQHSQLHMMSQDLRASSPIANVPEAVDRGALVDHVNSMTNSMIQNGAAQVDFQNSSTIRSRAGTNDDQMQMMTDEQEEDALRSSLLGRGGGAATCDEGAGAPSAPAAVANAGPYSASEVAPAAATASVVTGLALQQAAHSGMVVDPGSLVVGESSASSSASATATEVANKTSQKTKTGQQGQPAATQQRQQQRKGRSKGGQSSRGSTSPQPPGAPGSAGLSSKGGAAAGGKPSPSPRKVRNNTSASSGAETTGTRSTTRRGAASLGGTPASSLANAATKQKAVGGTSTSPEKKGLVGGAKRSLYTQIEPRYNRNGGLNPAFQARGAASSSNKQGNGTGVTSQSAAGKSVQGPKLPEEDLRRSASPPRSPPGGGTARPLRPASPDSPSLVERANNVLVNGGSEHLLQKELFRDQIPDNEHDYFRKEARKIGLSTSVMVPGSGTGAATTRNNGGAAANDRTSSAGTTTAAAPRKRTASHSPTNFVGIGVDGGVGSLSSGALAAASSAGVGPNLRAVATSAGSPSRMRSTNREANNRRRSADSPPLDETSFSDTLQKIWKEDRATSSAGVKKNIFTQDQKDSSLRNFRLEHDMHLTPSAPVPRAGRGGGGHAHEAPPPAPVAPGGPPSASPMSAYLKSQTAAAASRNEVELEKFIGSTSSDAPPPHGYTPQQVMQASARPPVVNLRDLSSADGQHLRDINFAAPDPSSHIPFGEAALGQPGQLVVGSPTKESRSIDFDELRTQKYLRNPEAQDEFDPIYLARMRLDQKLSSSKRSNSLPPPVDLNNYQKAVAGGHAGSGATGASGVNFYQPAIPPPQLSQSLLGSAGAAGGGDGMLGSGNASSRPPHHPHPPNSYDYSNNFTASASQLHAPHRRRDEHRAPKGPRPGVDDPFAAEHYQHLSLQAEMVHSYHAGRVPHAGSSRAVVHEPHNPRRRPAPSHSSSSSRHADPGALAAAAAHPQHYPSSSRGVELESHLPPPPHVNQHYNAAPGAPPPHQFPGHQHGRGGEQHHAHSYLPPPHDQQYYSAHPPAGPGPHLPHGGDTGFGAGSLQEHPHGPQYNVGPQYPAGAGGRGQHPQYPQHQHQFPPQPSAQAYYTHAAPPPLHQAQELDRIQLAQEVSLAKAQRDFVGSEHSLMQQAQTGVGSKARGAGGGSSSRHSLPLSKHAPRGRSERNSHRRPFF